MWCASTTSCSASGGVLDRSTESASRMRPACSSTSSSACVAAQLPGSIRSQRCATRSAARPESAISYAEISHGKALQVTQRAPGPLSAIESSLTACSNAPTAAENSPA